MNKIKNFYLQLSEKNFKIISIISLFLGDISISIYLWLKFTDKEEYAKSMGLITRQMKTEGGFVIPPNFAREVYELLIQSLIFSLIIFICFHIFIYTSFYLKKKFSYVYLKVMLFLAVPGSLLLGLSETKNSYFIIQSLLFLFVLVGILNFFKLKDGARS